ncbi:hypothetical protein F5884DRAFT_783627 [Xylogone sp. PMI_703]|nr:hypothetical protein F5884DRAFT_783627 [Xylogone sp. PMI_703]
MPPPVESWPARQLEDRVLIDVNGRRRKGWDGDLSGCELLELLQYRCEVEEPRSRESLTRCWPVERLFRRCKDQNGTFTAETTAWEHRKS